MLPYPFLTTPPPSLQVIQSTYPFLWSHHFFVHLPNPLCTLRLSHSFNPSSHSFIPLIPFVQSPYPIRSTPSSHLFNAPTSFIKSPHPIRSISSSHSFNPSSHSYNPLIPFVHSSHIPRTIPSFPMYVISLSWFVQSPFVLSQYPFVHPL